MLNKTEKSITIKKTMRSSKSITIEKTMRSSIETYPGVIFQKRDIIKETLACLPEKYRNHKAVDNCWNKHFLGKSVIDIGSAKLFIQKPSRGRSAYALKENIDDKVVIPITRDFLIETILAFVKEGEKITIDGLFEALNKTIKPPIPMTRKYFYMIWNSVIIKHRDIKDNLVITNRTKTGNRGGLCYEYQFRVKETQGIKDIKEAHQTPPIERRIDNLTTKEDTIEKILSENDITNADMGRWLVSSALEQNTKIERLEIELAGMVKLQRNDETKALKEQIKHLNAEDHSLRKQLADYKVDVEILRKKIRELVAKLEQAETETKKSFNVKNIFGRKKNDQ